MAEFRKRKSRLFAAGIVASLLCTLVSTLFGTAEKASAATNGIISGETYTIIAKHSGLAIGVSGVNNTVEGSSVIQGSDTGVDEAKWEITNLTGNYYKIINKNSGKALSVVSASIANGAGIVQNAYISGSLANDEWLLTDEGAGYYRLINRNSGKALNIPGVSQTAGTKLNQMDITPSDTQIFMLIQMPAPTYKFVVVHSGMVMDVAGSSWSDGAPIIQYPFVGSPNQLWNIVKLGGGYVKIINRSSGKTIAVEGGATSDGSKIVQKSYTAGDTTDDEWQLADLGGGHYQVLNRNSGKEISIPSASTASTTQFIQSTVDNGDNSKLQVILVPNGEVGITLPNFFTTNMVLQRNKNHIIWGKGVSGAALAVSLTNGSSLSQQNTIVDTNGNWTASLSPLPAGGPYTLTIQGRGYSKTIAGVYVGDVFVLAGQSNMERTYSNETTNASYVPPLPTNPMIKHFTLAYIDASEARFNVPFRDSSKSWLTLNEDNNKKLSLVGLFFAEQMLQENPNVPIGLISTPWGGTDITRWIRSSLENNSPNYTANNGTIYNNHIAPLTKYAIAGVLWYQGENDYQREAMYTEAFPTLINDWRNQWGKADLPFFYTQLARLSDRDFTAVREAQRLALTSVTNPSQIGMVVTMDTDHGKSTDIHPPGKDTIGKRMFLMAKNMILGQSSVVFTGPLFKKANMNGNKISVEFEANSLGGGLMIKDVYGQTSGGSLREFEIAGMDGIFTSATAVINPLNNTVEVTSASVPSPVYVRYAYSRVPQNPNLFNKAGLPASPFTTKH
ncbi:RICIN domain-containing protein [Paenibacillus anseongense]|uniref:RICIN domain-containing protein n=1 Tax=Paenibacillus anseongense TaxID=2682845 RepID=UPI002DBB911E|nr:RICIN domain-containing protein [Paenibacillus anseongense]MEC0267785.1 RICIN domain-containing protein [Paenibacillus anseongense]